MKFSETKKEALTHIERCDALFDGNTVRPDKEFAYNQMRILALELLEELQKLNNDDKCGAGLHVD